MENKTIKAMSKSEGFQFDEIVARKPNLIENEAVTKIIKQVLNQIDSSICHTIGPYGTNSLIQNFKETNSLFVTRDGYTIMKQLVYFDDIPMVVKNMIDGISEYMQNRIGDSTSSGIPIASALYTGIIDEYSPSGSGGWKLSPVGVVNILDAVFRYVIKTVFPRENSSEYIRIFDKMSEDEVINELSRVAGIALNNDFELGRTFAELYRGKLGEEYIIKIEDGSGVEDEFVRDSGYTIHGISVTDFTKMADSSTFGNACVLENPVIILFDGVARENDVPALKKLIKVIAFDMKREILIASENFSPSFNKLITACLDGTVFSEGGEYLDELPLEKRKPVKIKIATIPVGSKSDYMRDIFNDFVLMTNMKGVISTTQMGDFDLGPVEGVENITKFIENHSGTCERFIGGYSDSVFIGCKPDNQKYENHMKDLKEQLRKLETENRSANEMLILRMRTRIFDLNSYQTIIKVGAPNDSTRKSKRLVYDDAIRAMDTAIKEGGVCIGGNMAICRQLKKYKDEAVEDITESLISSKVNLCSGAQPEVVKDNVGKIVDIVAEAFGAAYRYSLFNMYQNEETVMERWEKCVYADHPTIFNIITDQFEPFETTNIIVPITTDLRLMEIVGSVIKNLITVNKMLPAYPPNFKIEQINNLISIGKNGK